MQNFGVGRSLLWRDKNIGLEPARSFFSAVWFLTTLTGPCGLRTAMATQSSVISKLIGRPLAEARNAVGILS